MSLIFKEDLFQYQPDVCIESKEQKELLEKEGVTFKDDHHVDLKKHQWKIK